MVWKNQDIVKVRLSIVYPLELEMFSDLSGIIASSQVCLSCYGSEVPETLLNLTYYTVIL